MNTLRNIIPMAAASVLLLTVSLVQADKTVDNFESYKAGQIIGKSYNSTPWCRFGHATNDNVVATGTDGKVVSGTRSAEYGAFWPNRFGAIRYVFDEPTDLNEYAKATVKIRSDKSTTNTRVKIAVSNGETTFISAAGQSLTDKIQHISFSLDPGDVILADGSDSYADVITNVKMIGLDFTSSEGQYNESLIFDDFELRNTIEDANDKW